MPLLKTSPIHADPINCDSGEIQNYREERKQEDNEFKLTDIGLRDFGKPGSSDQQIHFFIPYTERR